MGTDALTRIEEKLVLGGYTDIETTDEPVRGAVLSLRQARQLSNKIDAMLAKGVDVVEQFRSQERQQQTEQQGEALSGS